MIGSLVLRPGALLALWLASPTVLAATYPYSADTAAMARRQGAVPTGGIHWNCAGSRCSAISSSAVPAVAACHALVRQVGPVRSYGHKKRMLNAEELRQCNAGVPTGQPTGVSAPTLVRAPSPTAPAQNPVTINTSPLRYTGQGPVVINTSPLRYAGQGPVVINTSPLRYAGQGPVVINTAPLRYAGQGPVVIRTNVLIYSGTSR